MNKLQFTSDFPVLDTRSTLVSSIIFFILVIYQSIKFRHSIIRELSCGDTDLGLCGLSVCPPLKRIARPGGRDAPASPSLLTDSPAVETSSYPPIKHTDTPQSTGQTGLDLVQVQSYLGFSNQ